MKSFAGLIALVALCDGSIALAATREMPRRFIFAETKIANFELRAQTQVDWPNPQSENRYPIVDWIDCHGESPEIEFSVDETSGLTSLWFRFLDKPAKDGGQEEMTLLGDKLKLFVDGVEYQYRNIPRPPNEHFTNITYPAVLTDENAIMVVPWRGHTAVRRNDSEPWINISRIFQELSNAKKISWSFVSRDWSVVDKSVESNALPQGWQTKKYAIDVSGLRQSINWCSGEMASGKGRIAPNKILEHVEK